MRLIFILSKIKRVSLFSKLFPLALVFVLALGQAQGTESAEELYPHVKKETNFYVGKIVGKDLWMVMERMSDLKTINKWVIYTALQDRNYKKGSKLQGKDGKFIMPGFTKDGSSHAKEVVMDAYRNFKLTTDEVWFAYVTTNPTPMPINAYEDTLIENYDETYLPYKENYNRNKFPANILMYVTVTSSPTALITSHMGVSVSLEGIEQRQDGIGERISMDLHSFAAKVMLMRNPNRKYMINAPVDGMEKLIAQGLPPGSFFAGTREMRKNIDEAKKITFDDFKKQNINMQELENQCKQKVEYLTSLWNRSIENLKRERREKIISEIQYESELKALITQANELVLNVSEDHKLSITESSIKHLISETIEDKYKQTQPSYSFAGWPGAETMDELMNKYPPILSVDGADTKSIKERMTIFDKNAPDQPWLTIEAGNPDYNWIFSSPFAPAGQTHYIAADLKSMADSKQLDPMN